jgi:hypothetical protein
MDSARDPSRPIAVALQLRTHHVRRSHCGQVCEGFHAFSRDDLLIRRDRRAEAESVRGGSVARVDVVGHQHQHGGDH